MSFSIIISFGKWGGIYGKRNKLEWTEGSNTRLCLGYVALDILTPENDEYLNRIGRLFFPGWNDQ